MVRALLDGRKTQTRRLCQWANNPNSPALTYIVACDEPGWFGDEEGEVQFKAGYAPGDRLWVREAWAKVGDADDDIHACPDMRVHAYYRVDQVDPERQSWRPSIHMPRWASRLTLIVTDVRVERLQNISREDAIAEGLTHVPGVIEPNWWRLPKPMHQGTWLSPVAAFRFLWSEINGLGSWEANPWVVALTFDVHQQNIDLLSPERVPA